jgi:hypothetical protein
MLIDITVKTADLRTLHRIAEQEIVRRSNKIRLDETSMYRNVPSNIARRERLAAELTALRGLSDSIALAYAGGKK